MNKDYFDEYLALDEQAKLIEHKKAHLKAQIMVELEKSEDGRFEHPAGMFTVSHRKKWTYTDVVVKLEDKLSIQKTKEEKHGDATFEESSFLRFSPKKENGKAE